MPSQILVDPHTGDDTLEQEAILGQTDPAASLSTARRAALTIGLTPAEVDELLGEA